MIRTVNRQPFSVNVPSSNEAKDYFFNHINWKGMSDDKNFLTSDQETFESCKNVYVDSEGLLRSRPSLKIKKDTVGLKCLSNFWTFGNFILYLDKTSDERYDIYLTDFDNNIKFSTSTMEEIPYANDKIKPVLADDKLFLFATDSFRYLHLSTFELADASSFVYVPKSVVTSTGISSDSESHSILTNSEMFVYLYDSDFSVETLLGKTLSFTILDNEYEVVFDKYTPFNFYSKLAISVAASGNDILSAVYARDGYDSIAVLDKMSKTFMYSNNGSRWNRYLSAPDDVGSNKGQYYNLRFTDDGNDVYYTASNEGSHSVYMVSVVKNVNVGDSLYYKYEQFTDWYRENLGEANSVRTFIGVHFVSNSVGSSLFRGENYNMMERYDDGEYRQGGIHTSFQDVDLYFELDNYDDKNVGIIISRNYISMIDLSTFGRYRNDIDSLPSVVTDVKLFRTSKDSFILSVNSNTICSIYEVEYADLSFIKERDVEANESFIMQDRNFIVSKKGIWDVSADVFTRFNVDIIDLLGVGNYLYYKANITGQPDSSVYTNNVSVLELKEKIEKDDGKLIEFVSNFVNNGTDVELLSNYYFAINQELYVSEPRFDNDGNFLWYIPEYTKQSFTDKITGLQPISSTEMAIFLRNEIWYSQYSESVYLYNKSKLQVGLREGSDVITSYDGTQVIFPSKRGLVALSYQNFVASTDQVLTPISDPIHDQFIKFAEGSVKLLRYQYWIICYRTDTMSGYVYDGRNASWWPIEIFIKPTKVLDVDNKIVLLANNRLYTLDKSDDKYYDYDGNEHQIDWNIRSQKLHFNAINYCKHIANITLMSVQDSDNDLSFKLRVNNYRKKMDTTDVQTKEYKVDAIRTYVQRMSFPKVNEFQYILFADDEQLIRVPLSLSGITIKYRIGSQVR